MAVTFNTFAIAGMTFILSMWVLHEIYRQAVAGI